MYTKTDVFFIIVFIIVVSIIIGLNIVTLIDKKISDVSINIPPIKIPKIVIKVIKNDGRDEYVLDDSKEHFIVSDAQDFHNYKDLKKKTYEKEDNYDNEKINNPPPKDIVDYDKDQKGHVIRTTYEYEPKKYKKGRLGKSYITPADFGWEGPNQYVSCTNSSVADRYKTGDEPIVANQIACGYPNKLTAENYYKVHNAIPVPIEDYHIRGYNYHTYSSHPSPYSLRGMRILSRNTKGLVPTETQYKNIPIAYNYAFHNTPALPMP